MPRTCAVPGCKNSSVTSSKTLFQLPKDEKAAKSWVERIRRQDALPKEILVCEDHFKQEEFDSSRDMKIRFQTPGKIKLSRRLIPSAIPSIFPWTVTQTRSSISISKRSNLQMTQSLLTRDKVSECSTVHQQGSFDIFESPNETTESVAPRRISQMDQQLQCQIKPYYRSKASQTQKQETRSSLTCSVGTQCNIRKEQRSVGIQNQMALLPKEMASVETQTIDLNNLDFLSSTNNQSFVDDSDLDLDVSLNDSWLKASESRTTRQDPDYDNNSDEQQDSSLKLKVKTLEVNPMKQTVYLVYESCLEKLMANCPECNQPILEIVRKKCFGTQVVYEFSCLQGCETKWYSQPTIDAVKGLGNLAAVAAVDLACIPFPKIKKLTYIMNIPFIEKSTYYRLRGDYLFPEIDEYFDRHQRNLLASIQEPLRLAIDGQCDSPGHNATYCTVSVMDIMTEKIIDFKIIDVKEVKNSQGMELEGFVRCVDEIQDNEEKTIEMISTDRHTQVKKKMRTKYGHIRHEFDPWHLAKCISKKLTKLAKKKENRALAEWIPSIVNHLYWSMNTAKNGEEIAERFLSVVHHICNKHDFTGTGNKYYLKCEHAPYTKEEEKDRKWLKMGSPAHNALKKGIMQAELMKDMRKLSAEASTSSLEIFHALKIRYLPKTSFYEKEKMLASTKVAILDHNLNTGRKQATTLKEGKFIPRFKIAWDKRTGRFTASKVKIPKSYSFMKEIARNVYFRAIDRECASPNTRKLKRRHQRLRPSERLERDVIIENSCKYSRLSKTL